MVCYHPLDAWRCPPAPGSSKLGITFKRREAYLDKPVQVPCGQCIGCRLRRSREWAIRCMHEASLWEDNSFLTLTYDDEHVPPDRGLHYRDFQLFMYRVRKRFGAKIRFYMCGEYGEQYGRPHFHALFFNHQFRDLELFKGRGKSRLFVSAELQGLWSHGYSTIGQVTFESAAYVAGYIHKKVTGDPAQAHYEWTDPETGEVHERRPEFNNMSRRPGIGRGWLDRYSAETYRDDYVVVSGRKMRPPRYYDQVYEAVFAGDLEQIRVKRRRAARSQAVNMTAERLCVRERVATARMAEKAR